MSTKTRLSVATALLAAATTTIAMADDPSVPDALMIGSSGSAEPWTFRFGGTPAQPGPSAPAGGLVHDIDDRFQRTGEFRTVVTLDGPLGMVLDYSSGLPKFSGLSLSPSEAVRVEANGGMEGQFNDLRGEVSIHFRF